MNSIFLHGLDSSSRGTKASFFKRSFPSFIIADFTGSLDQRLAQLEVVVAGKDELCLVGSSFGGLMAACFAAEHPERVRKMILLAPALNFPGFVIPQRQIAAPTLLIIGDRDTVTPASSVVPLAEKSFSELQVEVVNDDHLLHRTFTKLDWQTLLHNQ